MAFLPRGIAQDLLLSQVKNTMPYLFLDPGSEGEGSVLSAFVPTRIMREFAAGPDPAKRTLSHFEYFRLCVSAHYLTCGTPVPTDVDNQIRSKLWPEALPTETALEMGQFVLESRHWDFTSVTARVARGAKGTAEHEIILSGHRGEWFTVAAAAYCGLARYADPAARELKQGLLDAIADETRKHSEVFGSLWRAQDGLGALKASASIAHNFGDLDRVMDMWSLGVGDPLRLGFYKLGVTPFAPDRKLRYLGRLWTAGELYKSTIDGGSMALENHRHFALRKPRCLRASRELLVPTGPFFDDWGKTVARYLSDSEAASEADFVEVAQALVQGWDRLPKTVGYGRALRGFLEAQPRLEQELDWGRFSPAQRPTLKIAQDRFEKKWADEALKLLDDIPSRA